MKGQAPQWARRRFFAGLCWRQNRSNGLCRLQLRAPDLDISQRGRAATRYSLSSSRWRRGPGRGGDHPSPRSSPHSFVVGRGRGTRAGANSRGSRRFGQILILKPGTRGQGCPHSIESTLPAGRRWSDACQACSLSSTMRDWLAVTDTVDHLTGREFLRAVPDGPARGNDTGRLPRSCGRDRARQTGPLAGP